MTPYTNQITTMLAQMETVWVSNNDFVKFILSVILSIEQLYEGFPNVVCEAMSCGLPVLCSNVCDNPNIVENGVNGYLFDPNNEIDIADTIEKFMKDMLPKADKIAKLNRDKIQHLCSPKAFVQKYLDIIK